MIAVMVGPSRLPALQYMTPAAYAWRQVGYSSSRTGSVAWRLVILPPVMRPLSAARLDLTLDMEALPAARQDRHWSVPAVGGPWTLSAAQRDRRPQA